jgi:aryl-alcohol dehydrogenase-like predicted oxidoreductase
MNYSYLPKTNLQVSDICLGTMMFGDQTSREDSLKIMDYAFDRGINFFDTANTYAEKKCEPIVGEGLKGRRDKIILATKVFGDTKEHINSHGLSRSNILSAVDASLKRLDTDYIDIYYLHAPDYHTCIEETMETMTDLVRMGKIRYVGVSNFAAWQIADILAVCDKRGYIAPVITQNVYNLITRGLEAELAPFLEAHKMAMAIYNPIAGGLLTGKHKMGTPASNTRFANNKMYYNRYWSEENFHAVEALEKLASNNGITPLELAMKWCKSRKTVTSIISGVSRLSQLEQNIASIEGAPLSEDILAECDNIWHSLSGTRFQYNR